MQKLRGIIVFIFFTALFYFSLFFLLYSIKDDFGKPFIYHTEDYYLQKGGNAYRTFHNFDRNKQYDIVVLGASHAYRGYDPRIFNKHGLLLYVLGTSNQSIINEYFVLKEYIRERTTRLIILDVYDECFLENGYEFESAADMIPNLNGSVFTPLKLAFALNDFRAINMCVMRQFNKPVPAINLDQKQYIYNGYCENTDSIKKPVESDKITDQIGSTKLFYLKKLLETAIASKIKIVAINHPNPNKNYRLQHEKFMEIIQPILKSYDVPLLDYAYVLPMDSKNHFYDYTHMNQAGVTIFNEVLINDLQRLKIL